MYSVGEAPGTSLGTPKAANLQHMEIIWVLHLMSDMQKNKYMHTHVCVYVCIVSK